MAGDQTRPSSGATPTASGRVHLFSLLMGVIVMATITNLAQFSAIESRARGGYKALQQYAETDLLKIAAKKNPTVRHRYAEAIAMRRVAPGSTIVIPSNIKYPHSALKVQLIAFGGIKGFRKLDYDPSRFRPKRLDWKRQVRAKTPKGRRPHYLKRKFVLLAEKSKKKKRRAGSEFILLKRGNTDAFVETSLIAREVGKLKP